MGRLLGADIHQGPATDTRRGVRYDVLPARLPASERVQVQEVLC